MPKALIGIGSNVGNRRQHLASAVQQVDGLGELLSVSPIYETAPVGEVAQGSYLNAVAELETDLRPNDLLTRLLNIERAEGRVRDEKWGPRTLDLDILTFDNLAIHEPGLEIPHPEIRSRRFVLAPLADVSPAAADETGAFIDGLAGVADQNIRRVSGPYLVAEDRWMESIESATELTETAEGFHAGTSKDWVNRTGYMFGAFLSALALRAVGAKQPDHMPSSLVYRFVRPVPLGATVNVAPTGLRQSSRSSDYDVTLSVDGETVGKAIIGTLARSHPTTDAPEAPAVLPPSECIPIDALIGEHGIKLGPSASSWKSLERWDILDLVDGTSGLLRGWCPNVVVGSPDAYVRACGVVMPIDALIWPAIMDRVGSLGTGKMVFTPTVEFSALFTDLDSDPLFHLGEVSVDHMTAQAAKSNIRVWADDGTHLATGSSSNLLQFPG